MKKAIVIIGVLTTTSCGMFATLTEEQVKKRNKIEYQIDKAYLKYTIKRDSLMLEYYYDNETKR